MARQNDGTNPESDAVRTPEGDNENSPDAPLQPGVNTDGLQPWPAIDTNNLGQEKL